MEEEQRESSSDGVKLVPWMSWDEWLFVYHSLFSHDPISVASALTRISTWRSRGCIPVTVEVTASIIEIQQKDPQLRNGRAIDAADGNQVNDISDTLLSEEMLAMLYCMAIMRLVNGVVEKTRKQRDFSIAVAADAIGLPRMLIDIRHEGSHRELPTLQVVRSGAAKAIDWLLSYYWEPQRKAIPFLGDSITKIRKRIESKLQELVLCLNIKEISQPSSPSPLKGKRNKKQAAKILKKLAGLYSSCPSEVVSVLLDYLLKAISLPNSVGTSGEPISDPSIDSLLEYWKPVVKALLQKDAELIVALLKAVLDMIEIQEDNKFKTGLQNLMTSQNTAAQQVEQLSSLFAWLIRNVKQQVKPRQRNDSAAETKSSSPEIPKAILTQLLRKCLMRSCLGNKLLMNSTFNIVQLIGDEDHLMKKLNKLASLVSSNLEIINCTDTKNLLTQQDESIPEATKNLELIKSLRRKRKAPETTTDDEIVSSRRWVVTESWNPCPIGMLPNSAGSSGCLPVLDLKDGLANNIQDPSPERNETSCDGEIEAESPICDGAGSDKSCFKKSKVTPKEDFVFDGGKDDPKCSGIDGKLMIGGVWSEIGEDDILAIKSSIRILV